MSKLEATDIRLEGIAHVLSDNALSVPRYQRSYTWEEKHVTDFLQDIQNAIEKNEEEYFFGTIVIANPGEGVFEVIDGQQRLATAAILLTTIRDYFMENDDENRADSIHNEFLIKMDRRTEELIPKLKLNETDNDFFLKQILEKPERREQRPSEIQKSSHKKIIKALELAKSIINKISEMQTNPADNLLNWVEYLEKNAVVIVVKVPDYSNAFVIFETLNDRGLDLAISDLLKNYLYHHAGDRIEEVQQRWSSMVGKLESIDKETILVTFIRHFWSSKNGYTREKDLYKAIKEKIKSKQSAINLANDLEKYAEYYAAIINQNHEFWGAFGPSTRKHIDTLNLFGMEQIRPLLLAVIDKFEHKEIKKVLKLVVSWAVRFLISGGLGGGKLETHYSHRAQEITNGKIKTKKDLVSAMKNIVPNDSQFKASFETATVSKNYLARYYLRALEKKSAGETEPELVPNPNQEEITLEHVLPENPSAAWGVFEAEEIKAFYKRIGNLCLVKKSINKSIGNKGFNAKKPHYRKSHYKLTKSISKYQQWRIPNIEKRQRELAEIGLKTWPIK